jgi:hypothetical protein
MNIPTGQSDLEKNPDYAIMSGKSCEGMFK